MQQSYKLKLTRNYLISDVYSPVKVACPMLFSQIAKAKVAFCVLYPDISTSGDDKT